MEKKKIGNIDDFLCLLNGVKRLKNGQYVALCPAHNDHNPSLSIRQNKDKILIHCQAGCATEAVLKAMSLDMSDLSLKVTNPHIVAIYRYQDANGKLLFEVVRYEPKGFSQRQPDGSGGYIDNMNGITPVLYHLPDILQAIEYGDTVYLTEGEKDCDRLWQLGLVATTNPMGAKKWKTDYTKTLRGGNIVLIPDTDAKGREHAGILIQALQDKVASLKVAILPPDIDDISDWLDRSNTLEQLEALIYDYPNDYINSFIYCPVSDDLASKRDKSVTDSVTSIPELLEEPLSKKILAFVEDSAGWWSTSELDREVGIASSNDKDNRRQILKRMREAGVVEQHPKQNRLYRYINVQVHRLNFKTAGRKSILDLKWPFSIEDYADVYPGNEIVVAGSQNAGKTALLLNFIYLNQDRFPIFYFCSEMGESELGERLNNFQDIDIDDWNFEAIDRSSNFADVIRPDCINIIDYLEITENFYLVAQELSAIHDKLESGIVAIALQKNSGAMLGRGGSFGLERPRLYLSMDYDKLTIVKAKNWHDKRVNPNRMVARFTIQRGCDFKIIHPLRHEDSR